MSRCRSCGEFVMRQKACGDTNNINVKQCQCGEEYPLPLVSEMKSRLITKMIGKGNEIEGDFLDMCLSLYQCFFIGQFPNIFALIVSFRIGPEGEEGYFWQGLEQVGEALRLEHRDTLWKGLANMRVGVIIGFATLQSGFLQTLEMAGSLVDLLAESMAKLCEEEMAKLCEEEKVKSLYPSESESIARIKEMLSDARTSKMTIYIAKAMLVGLSFCCEGQIAGVLACGEHGLEFAQKAGKKLQIRSHSCVQAIGWMVAFIALYIQLVVIPAFPILRTCLFLFSFPLYCLEFFLESPMLVIKTIILFALLAGVAGEYRRRNGRWPFVEALETLHALKSKIR